MIELAQHIEALLLENDCVIIPGFGGFVAHYATSRRIEAENLFLSPTRTLGFNSQLKLNDGLLVQSYMSVCDRNFPEASKLVEEDVNRMIQMLHEEGKVDFPNIGEIQFTLRGNYEFTPYNDKVATPHLYGVDSFEMQTLSAIRKSEERKIQPIHPVASTQRSKMSGKTFIPGTFLRSAVAVAGAVVLFFYLSTPVENTYIERENYAQMLPVDLFEKIEAQSVMTTPVAVNSAKKQQAKTATTVAVQKKESKKTTVKPVVVKEVKVAPVTSQEKVQPAENGKYHLIVAGGISKEDAEIIATRLRKEGHAAAQVLTGDGKVRVSILSCMTREEANRQLLRLRENEAYKTAWMLAR